MTDDTDMIRICRYTPADKESWNRFVADSKNGTFLFLREYMDYHADRFCDHSLLFYDEKERLLALLPGNEVTEYGSDGAESRRLYYSHGGLTYGGFIFTLQNRAAGVLQLFEALLGYLKREGFTALYYKKIPVIYHRYPSQEDDYALWRCGAQRCACHIAGSVDLTADRLRAVDSRRTAYCRKAIATGYRLRTDAPLADFWPILVENLQARHGVSPVHSLSEIELLQRRFPENIRCFLAEREVEGAWRAEAGVVVYETPPVAHAQYISASPTGKSDKVLNFLFLSLIERYAADARFRYFDFGTSCEQGGHYLNEGLAAQKEGLGGRGVVYETYCLTI